MANNPSLQPLEQICQKINDLQVTLASLDGDLQCFEQLSNQIKTVGKVFPDALANDLNIFSDGLNEVAAMLTELDQMTLDKLHVILEGASTGIETISKPIPPILADMNSVSSLMPAIQTAISVLHDPAEGVDASIQPLKSKLNSWSNTTAQNPGNDIGTGVLNAIHSELQKMIADNISFKNAYDTEVNSIIGSINQMATDLDGPVSSLSADSGKLDSLLKNVNAFLTVYFTAITSASSLSSKVDSVVSLLDKFKPNVDLVYGIMKPLSWFIELVESKTCNQTSSFAFDVTNASNRISHYADATAPNESKFQAFQQAIESWLEKNNVGALIDSVVQNMLPINDLQTATDSLNRDLQALSKNVAISSLGKLFITIGNEIVNVENILQQLSTAAKRASGTVTFQRTHPGDEVILQRGTCVMSTTGNIVYVITEQAVISTNEFTSSPVNTLAQAVGTSANISENGISVFITTPVKQMDNSYKNTPNPVYGDNFSVIASSAFTGGTDLSINQIQGQAKDLANKMLPTLKRLRKV